MRQATIIAIASAIVLALFVGGAALYFRKPVPLSVSKEGIARGTGQKTYRYRSGATKLVEDYVNGKQVRSEWFRPDDTSVLITNWQEESGVGLYLREDGTIRKRMTYVRGVAHGPVTYYTPDGAVKGEAIFENGSRVSGYEATPGNTDE